GIFRGRYPVRRGNRSKPGLKMTTPDVGRRLRIEHETYSVCSRCDLLQHFRPFAWHRRLKTGEARDIPAWSRKVGDETVPDRIGHLNEDDRDALGLLAQCEDWGRSVRNKYVRPERDEFSCQCREPSRISGSPTVIDVQITAVDPTQLLQSLVQRRHH